MELRIEALARYAKRQQSTDPVGYLEDLLFTKITEITEAGAISETAEGGRSVRFAFAHNERPGELIMAAIRYCEREIATGSPPAKVHQADFSSIEL